MGFRLESKVRGLGFDVIVQMMKYQRIDRRLGTKSRTVQGEQVVLLGKRKGDGIDQSVPSRCGVCSLLLLPLIS